MYALILVSKSHERNPWPDSMHRVLYKMQEVEGVTRLNEGAWLVHLDIALLFHARLIQIAHDEGLPHHVAYFDQKPSFLSTVQPE